MNASGMNPALGHGPAAPADFDGELALDAMPDGPDRPLENLSPVRQLN